MRCIKNQAGFTMVELGIALLIIGILIAGILKGVELVGNARVISTINQIKEIEAASLIFQNKYSALPGDVENPADRIVNCSSAQCIISGNGDGFIDLNNDPKESITWSTTGESRNYWLHLAVTGMLSGINASYSGTPTKYGVDFLKAPIGGGWQIQSFNDGGRKRTFMMLATEFAPTNVEQMRQLTPAQAHQIDAKMDDGLANRGIVQSYSPATDGICTRSGGTADDMNAYLAAETEIQGCILWVQMMRRM